MKSFSSLLTAACLCTLPLTLAANQPASGKSPGGHVSYEIRPAADGKEVWVYRDNETTRANKMCETVGSDNLKLFFSPDDRWIIVQDGGASLGVSLRLFHREGEHSYAERDKEDIGTKAENAALKSDGFGGKDLSDHRYAECLAWSADSRCVLVRVSGKGDDGTNHVQFSWVGVYDLDTGKVSADLSKLNKLGVRRWPHGSTVSDLPFIGAQ